MKIFPRNLFCNFFLSWNISNLIVTCYHYLEKVEYENGNFAPSHLQQLYMAQFEQELLGDETPETCKTG